MAKKQLKAWVKNWSIGYDHFMQGKDISSCINKDQALGWKAAKRRKEEKVK